MSPQNVRLLPLSYPSFHPPPLKVPHLGLHAAAATGNIGLAKYAISHGQPVNSVIDGVLPLHAACSGGNEMVVRLLIDNGADVNAPRFVSLSSSFFSPTFFFTFEWLRSSQPAKLPVSCNWSISLMHRATISPSPDISVNRTLALTDVYCL